MLRRKFDRMLLVSLLVTGVVAACGSSDEGDDDGVDGADSGTSSGASGTPGTSSGTPGTSSGASGTTSSGASGTTSSGASGTTSSGASGDPDASTDGGDDEDADATIPDGPDLDPVVFPAGNPNLFGYKMDNVYPGAALFASMDMAWPAGSNQPFVLHRQGYILRMMGGTTIQYPLDFSGEVVAQGEGGALGMALHPEFTTGKAFVYVWYNATGGYQRLTRWRWNGNAFVERFVMINQKEYVTEHNAAHIRFGPDGFLYFGNGDDQRPVNDVNATYRRTTQRLDYGLFSGIFRIDVDMKGGAISHAPPRQPTDCTTQGYFIPNDNPFVGTASANEEYYALGFRNPYSFNFDRQTGKLWLGEVGDSFREEVDEVVKGGNYGWPLWEGKRNVRNTPALGPGVLTAPFYDYSHARVADLTSTMGGYVYRGAAMPELQGKFLFSDWPTGRVWALDLVTGIRTSLIEAPTDPGRAPVGWGQDADGEIYLIAWTGIYKITRDNVPHGLPLKLSQTNIFRNLSTLKTSSKVIPYSIRSPLWSDGAAKKRWVYVPDGQTASLNAANQGTATPNLPKGSMLVKQFDLPDTANPVGRSRRLETRVLVVGDPGIVYGVTYRWNAAGTDADLLTESVDENIVDAVNPAESVSWHFPSFGDCLACHRTENTTTQPFLRVLGFRGEQLNFDLNGENQLTTLVNAGIFSAAGVAAAPAPLADPSDPAAPIGDRAIAYLASNCSPCHHPGASFLGGGDTWNANPVVGGNRGILGVTTFNNYPMQQVLGLAGRPLVNPGNADQSVLIGRIRTTDEDVRMPPIGRSKVDPVGNAVLTQWVNSL